MDTYPEPARRLVDAMSAAATAEPWRTIAFQGAPGAYSHQAVREAFPDALPLPCISFEDAIAAVQSGVAAKAVIPIENSLHGRVADIHFLLPESGLHIVGEHFVRVRHCLLSTGSRAEIREAMSHPQALGQVRVRLKDWGIKPVVAFDTAGAAAFVAETGDASVGAIASALSAELYGLNIHAEGVEDASHNTTRFVVLSREPLVPPAGVPVMTTLMFETNHVPASLFKALGGFATNGVNLTKLESYLRDGSFSQVEFYADIEGAPEDQNVARALEELRFHTKWLRLLGTYQRGRPRGG